MRSGDRLSLSVEACPKHAAGFQHPSSRTAPAAGREPLLDRWIKVSNCDAAHGNRRFHQGTTPSYPLIALKSMILSRRAAVPTDTGTDTDTFSET